MSANELKSYPITDLLKIERRKELVPKLVFAKGVTTFVTPSGGGKTTLCFSMGLYVSVAQWGDEEIEQRPTFWIAGEDQDGLRAIFEAWTKHNPELRPDARFMEEAVDFANSAQVRWLIDHLKEHFKGKPPPLIMADALSDILAVQGLDEDKSKEVAKVYKGIWQVVKEAGTAVVVLHHSGWDEKRERGSSTIRQKSDIVVKIVSFDPQTGIVRLEHLKRRSGAGPKLTEFYLGAKLVTVDGYSAPIPIVTGPSATAVPVGAETTKKTGKEARQEELDWLVLIRAMQLSKPPEHLIQYSEWFELTKAKRKEGLGTETFSKAVKRLTGSGKVRKVGELYQVVAGEAEAAAEATSGPGAAAFTSTSGSTSGSPLIGGEKCRKSEVSPSGSTSGSSEVSSTERGNDQNTVVPKAPPDDGLEQVLENDRLLNEALGQLLKKSNGKPNAR
jgi:AAA domain